MTNKNPQDGGFQGYLAGELDKFESTKIPIKIQVKTTLKRHSSRLVRSLLDQERRSNV